LLAQLLGGDFAADEANAPPIHWPSLPAEEYGQAMRDLYDWTARLQHRFREMVRLPPCWHRHNGIVELLSALRDSERASYAPSAPPASAVAWMLTFRDVEARLRAWIGDLRCGGDPHYHDQSVHAPTTPDTTPPDDLTIWIAEAEQARRKAALDAAVND
jgi:hypothetical protein